MRDVSILFLILTALWALPFAAPHDDLFYVPDNLKSNVAFWEIIYQRIPSDRGLLHDADSLRVIYDTVRVNGLSGRARSRAMKEHLNELSRALRALPATDPSQRDSLMLHVAAAWGRELTPDEAAAAAERIRFQLGQRDRFIQGLERSGRYINRIQEVFRENGLPEELAYLPHVESSFNYKAYSKVGAAGIWQFMRSTGRLYMKIGYVIDERLDPIKSTYAAAKLLKSNFNRLGSWPLAVTAYNHGPNSMARAIDECGTTDFGVVLEQYRTRSFQFASRNFYACFVAAHRTASNYQTLFGDIQIEPCFQSTEVKLDKYYKPVTLAKMFCIPLKTLQEYNLALRPAVFQGNQFVPRDFVLKLPLGYNEKKVDSLLACVPPEQAPEEVSPESFHRVEPGENLSLIALRYNINLTLLLATNNLTPRTCIYPGQLIMLPGASKTTTTTTVLASPPPAPHPKEAVSETPMLSALPGLSCRPVFLLMGRRNAGSDLASSVTLNLMDSLPTLWNFLYPAQLALACADGVRPCEFCEFNANNYTLDFLDREPNSVTLRVQVDETLGHLAEWSGLTLDQIRRFNHISSTIRLGQKLKLPLTEDKANLFLSARIEYHMGIEEDFFNNYQISGMDTLVVRRGTSLWGICLEKELPLWLVLKANPSIGTDLQLGNTPTLFLPVVEEKKN